jgi:hypothetical protein
MADKKETAGEHQGGYGGPPAAHPVEKRRSGNPQGGPEGAQFLPSRGSVTSSLFAAEKTGRRARVMEIAPHYADVIIRRWEAYAGKSAVHVATGLTFEDMAAQRATIPIAAPPPNRT